MVTAQGIASLPEIDGKRSTAVARAPSRFKFSKEKIDTLPAPTNGQNAYFYDNAMNHLAVRVTPSGNKYFVWYGRINGTPKRPKIGDYPEMSIDRARKEAAKITNAVACGADPTEERKAVRNESTLRQLFEEYREHHGKTIRTASDDAGIFENHLKPWESRKISSIKQRDVIMLHKKITVESGPIIANRVVERLRTFYNHAIAMEWKGANPAKFVKRNKEVSRERFVQPDEMLAFLEAIKQEPEDFRDFFKLLLLTGARRSNVQAMRWDDLNLKSATWVVPDTESKNGTALSIVLTPEALEILRTREPNESEWVFPSNGNRVSESGHLQEPKGAWARVLARCKLKNLRMHDVRRTYGAYLAAAGVSLPIIGKSLGHKSTAATMVYARLNLDSVRDAVGRSTSAMLKLGDGNGN